MNSGDALVLVQCSDRHPRDVNEVHIFRHTLSKAALNQTLVQYKLRELRSQRLVYTWCRAVNVKFDIRN